MATLKKIYRPKNKPQIDGAAVIKVRHLARVTNIDYMRIYNSLSSNGRYNSLTEDERTRLMNALHDELVQFFKEMGFEMVIKRIKKEVA